MEKWGLFIDGDLVEIFNDWDSAMDFVAENDIYNAPVSWKVKEI